ncbi:Hypothetical protein, putative [Bodo saltans]|uniref:Katanin p60 ATPase-containing subunit A1 n=1 Tax=Bodo saltans TaxID=75058 RepID=A0A0S4IUM1_BODSA|nr:Hypothetical protein, putative [Bodo saltans]|eukprot:CUE95680.1 Hypothetical protein, putative [Bodo saltans]
MSTSQEIYRAVKQARRYALEGNYDAAITFYTGLEVEVSAYAGTLGDRPEAFQWNEVRQRMAAERAVLVELQQELAALVNPAEAVRRDRQLARGGGAVDDAAPAPTAGRSPPDQGPYAVRDMRPAGGNRAAPSSGAYSGPSGPQGNNRRHVDAPPPASDWSSMDDYTAPIRNAVRGAQGGGGTSSATVNEHLYGDRDRFGPAEGPAMGFTPPTRQPSNVAPKVAPSGRPAPTRTPPSQPAQPARQNGGGAAGGKEKKPPIPKFGKRNDNIDKGDPTNGRPKFCPRAGEEELASLIEADMYVGNLNVSFSDIAGQEEAKGLLEEAVVYPILMPDYFQGIRRPWKGILMYGPPGTGKTMLAKAVASECGTTFFNISPATLTSKWRGEGEKLIRVLFDMARHYAPSTIFIDEIDSLCGQRGGGDEHEASRRAKGVLLTQMDGVGVDPGKIVMVLGATNHPWDIDEAMRRRLEKRIYIPLPTHDDRIELFKINTRSLRLAPNVDFDRLSKILDDHFYSAADITTVARDAAMMTMRRFLSDENTKKELKLRGAEIGKLAAEEPVSMDDFMNAIRKVPSSVNVDQIKKFEEWKKEFETIV